MKQVRERQTPRNLTYMWNLKQNNKKPKLEETGETVFPSAEGWGMGKMGDGSKGTDTLI